MRPMHFLVVIITIVVIFGINKLPDIVRNLGKSAKILKQDIHELGDGTGSPVPDAASDSEGEPTRDGAQYVRPVSDES